MPASFNPHRESSHKHYHRIKRTLLKHTDGLTAREFERLLELSRATVNHSLTFLTKVGAVFRKKIPTQNGGKRKPWLYTWNTGFDLGSLPCESKPAPHNKGKKKETHVPDDEPFRIPNRDPLTSALFGGSHK